MEAKNIPQPKKSGKDYYIQKGRREVVEWITTSGMIIVSDPEWAERWQTKLKEWGIK